MTEELVLVCGDRNWTNWWMIINELRNLGGRPTIMHGGARGADTIAGTAAKQLDFNVKVFPAKWYEHGKSAGPRRNIEMLEQKPDKVLAFHSDLENSKGTKHMVEIARKAGVPVFVFGEGIPDYDAN